MTRFSQAVCTRYGEALSVWVTSGESWSLSVWDVTSHYLKMWNLAPLSRTRHVRVAVLHHGHRPQCDEQRALHRNCPAGVSQA